MVRFQAYSYGEIDFLAALFVKCRFSRARGLFCRDAAGVTK